MRAELYAGLRKGTRALYSQRLALNILPRRKRKPSEWASQVRVIAAGTSPLDRGENMRYNHAIMPHCVEIMDAADDPSVRKIVLWMAIRDGKTLSVCSNIIGRTITDAPGNIYSVHPTEDNAETFSNGDIEPMIEACLSEYFGNKKSRDAGRTIEFKKFKGGWMRILSAKSLAKFHGTSVAVLLLHELDQLEPEAIFKAFGRTTGFAEAIIVMESTGTLASELDEHGHKIYHSNIEEAFDQGDKRKWFCACHRCGFLQTLRYEQIKYSSGRMEAAAYHCEACDYGHNPKEWRKMAAGGKWYPTAGLSEEQERDIAHNFQRARAIDPSVRSYWRNGFNSLLPHSKGYKSKLHQFVAEGEAAQRSIKAKKIWTQEVRNELWNPMADGEPPPPWRPIFERREDYGLIVPAGGLFLTAFCDVQKNRLEVGWRAWGREEESWGLDHVVLDGYVGHQEVWGMLRLELARKWQHASGATMRLGMSFVDGGAYSEEVYRFFQQLARDPVEGVYGHCQASKGWGKFGIPIVSRGDMATIARTLKGRYIGTWQAKDRIYDRLKMSLPKPGETREGFMHYNLRFGEEFFVGLTRETATRKIEGGNEFNTYKDEVSGNEPLDIEVGNFAAFRLRNHNFDTIERELAEQVAEKSAPKKEKPPTAQPGAWALQGVKW